MIPLFRPMRKAFFKATILLTLVLAIAYPVHAQTGNTDSIATALKHATQDTTRCKLYNYWGESIYLLNPDSSAVLWNKAKAIAEKNLQQGSKEEKTFYKHILPYIYNNLGAAIPESESLSVRAYYAKALRLFLENRDSKGAGSAYDNLGYICEILNRQGEAESYYRKALVHRELAKDKDGLANTYNNLGYLLNMQGNIQALDYLTKSLKLREELKSKEDIAHSLNNLGAIYQEEGDHQKAMEYHLRALKLREEIQDKTGQQYSLINIAHGYGLKKQYAKAITYFERAIALGRELEDLLTLAQALNLAGNLLMESGELEKAFAYYTEALHIFEQTKNSKGLSGSYRNIGALYEKKGQMAEAVSFYEKSLHMAKENGYPSIILIASENLYNAYKKLGRPADALAIHELYVQMKDSIRNEESKKTVLKTQYENEYNRKEIEVKAASKLENETLALKASEDKKRQNLIIYSVTGGLLLLSVFSVIIYRGLRENQKANKIISKQKELVEEKNLQIEEKQKEIIDSINYAQRIQRSLLASETLLREHLQDYFILFKPKDIVSGDFYWAKKLSSGDFALVTADSTGHGVPGAIMSMLNIACLNEATSKDFSRPDDILFETRRLVIEHLKNDGSQEGGKDGMDCSLICLNDKRETLSYAAANNPVWHISDQTLTELLPDKMPVGKHDKDYQPFSCRTINVKKGDMIYTLTDGFPDQFGGPKGKKFMYKPLKELLISISGKPVDEQKTLLLNQLETWKGLLDQVDDICIIGIRI